MATHSNTILVQSAECSEQSGVHLANSNINVAPPPLQQPSGTSVEGPVAILWDIENCPVPSDVRPDDVAGNIRMALRVHPVIKGAVTMFSAYGDFNAFPRRLREGCQRTGVKLVDVPNGRKDAADKAILVDMFLFALDNRPPSSIMLISGDVDFAPALHILGQRGYAVILVIPSGVGVSSALSNAGRFVWDWPSVARGVGFVDAGRFICGRPSMVRGEGFIPSKKPLMAPRGGSADIAGYLMGCHVGENADGDEEEAIMYGGISQSCYNTKDFSILSRSLFEDNSASLALPCCPTTLRSHSLPSCLNETTMDCAASNDQNEMNQWVQPGDVSGLKGQLVKLLELSGGCLPLARVPAEYQKLFGRPLYISEYGACRLVNLLKKMTDAVAVEGKGQKKFVCLRNSKVGPAAHATATPKKDKRGISTQVENVDTNAGCGSSDEISDEEGGVVEESNERRAGEKPTVGAAARCQSEDEELGRFKLELQEILVSFSCRIFLTKFEEIYQQRYKKLLNYKKYGVEGLEELVDKVRDVVVLYEEPESRRKFIIAASY